MTAPPDRPPITCSSKKRNTSTLGGARRSTAATNVSRSWARPPTGEAHSGTSSIYYLCSRRGEGRRVGTPAKPRMGTRYRACVECPLVSLKGGGRIVSWPFSLPAASMRDLHTRLSFAPACHTPRPGEALCALYGAANGWPGSSCAASYPDRANFSLRRRRRNARRPS